MSKFRYVNTRFWDDNYTSNLDPIEKLLFLYCLTNTSTNICGVYEIPIKKIAMDTGVDKDMVLKILDRFTKDGKVFYINGWLAIKNFIKHQTINPKTETGIVLALKDVPTDVMVKLIDYGYPIYTLSHSNTNNNINTNNNTNNNIKYNLKGADIIKAFELIDPKNKSYYGNKTQRSACDFLINEYGFDTVMKVIGILPKTNQMDYMPAIYTPYELKEKWNKLKAQLQKNYNKTPLMI